MFVNFKDLFKSIIQPGSINIDNAVCTLHHTVTTTILLTFAIILSLEQLVGDPIDCNHGMDNMPHETLIDAFCWASGTWTSRLKGDEKHGVSGNLDHLGKCDFNNPDADPENCWLHMYYPWVTMALAAQVAFFVAPKHLWEFLEGNKVESLIKGAEVEKKLEDGKTEKEYPDALSKDALIKGLQTPEELMENKNLIQLAKTCFQTRGQHDGWAMKFYMIEILYLVNIFVQFFFLDYFLDGHFSEVGQGGLITELHQSVLPITTHCYYKYYGGAGGPSKASIQCVLPMNMINQKVFTVLYYWLGLLLMASVMMLVLRIFLVISPTFRGICWSFIYGVDNINSKMLSRSSHGDFLLWTLLLKNMNAMVNAQFVELLGKEKAFDRDM